MNTTNNTAAPTTTGASTSGVLPTITAPGLSRTDGPAPSTVEDHQIRRSENAGTSPLRRDAARAVVDPLFPVVPVEHRLPAVERRVSPGDGRKRLREVGVPLHPVAEIG